MKIKIQTEDGEKEIDMKSVKGKHIKKIWKFYNRMVKEDVEAASEYLEYVDNLAGELSGMTVEELDELDIDEKLKLTKTITSKVMSSLDFTKPLLR